MRLLNKKAIITGSGSGFGRETALTFTREGADILIAGINFESNSVVRHKYSKRKPMLLL